MQIVSRVQTQCQKEGKEVLSIFDMMNVVHTLTSMELIVSKYSVLQRFPFIRLDTETEFIHDALKADEEMNPFLRDD